MSLVAYYAEDGAYGIIWVVRRGLAYFGLDRSAPWRDWARAAVDVLPPVVVAVVVAWLDGVGGLNGWALVLVYLLVAWAVWLPLVVWLAPWWRSAADAPRRAGRRR